MESINIPYAPRPEQLQIHDALDRARFVVVVAHRRMGKTVSSINQLIKSACCSKQESPRYAYIAPTYSQAKRIAWDYLIKYTQPLKAEKNIAELRIDFWGRRIQLYGSDNPDSLRGQYFDGVILDEVGDQNPRIWSEILRPALADRRGWAIFLGTPKGNNHFKDLRDRAREEKDWEVLEFKVSDTNILPEDELEAAKREMGVDKYEQEFECSFHAPITGSYYGSILNELENQKHFTKLERDHLTKIFCAWDLGIGDSTAIWVAQTVGQEIHFLDYIENHGQALGWYVEELTRRDWHKAEQLLPHDVEVRELGTGKTRLEMLRESGLECRVLPRLSVDDGIQAVRRMLPKCWFDEVKTKEGLNALRNYRREYDEKRAVYFDKPVHDWASHGSDAMRYMAVGLGRGESNWQKPIPIQTNWVV